MYNSLQALFCHFICKSRWKLHERTNSAWSAALLRVVVMINALCMSGYFVHACPVKILQYSRFIATIWFIGIKLFCSVSLVNQTVNWKIFRRECDESRERLVCTVVPLVTMSLKCGYYRWALGPYPTTKYKIRNSTGLKVITSGIGDSRLVVQAG